MFKKIIQYALPALLLFVFGVVHADDSLFSTNLYAKFHAGSCTICHDFFEKDKNGLTFTTHKKRRDTNRCITCHKTGVTGFEHSADWFALPGLYTSDMDAKTTCEKIMEAMNAAFKSKPLLAKEMEDHLLADPRVLWGIEGATPNSGNLPRKKKETDMVKGGMDEWKEQVMAWIEGGMKCE